MYYVSSLRFQVLKYQVFLKFNIFAGDYEEALAYYSRSISLHRNAASINNRALTFLRMEKWKDAEKDCDEVLKLEKDNVKAKLRRATALKELDRFEEAKLDLEFVLRKVRWHVDGRVIDAFAFTYRDPNLIKLVKVANLALCATWALRTR